VIVRIATQGQFRLSDDQVARLNELDNEAAAAVEANDEARLHELLAGMAELVRREGEEVADDDLVQSDVIVPPPDTSLDQARAEFSGEGLIPG
jgi:hypothetical protein